MKRTRWWSIDVVNNKSCSNGKPDYIMKRFKRLPVKGVCRQRAKPIIAPIPLWSYLCVHLLRSALWDYTKSYWAEGKEAKISRPEPIPTQHYCRRSLSFRTKQRCTQTNKKERSFACTWLACVCLKPPPRRARSWFNIEGEFLFPLACVCSDAAVRSCVTRAGNEGKAF